jgi:hypothetical protein
MNARLPADVTDSDVSAPPHPMDDGLTLEEWADTAVTASPTRPRRC